ncbi:MAG TPA: low temperature requirement protein A [Solirubrobacteraceae bacterium]
MTELLEAPVETEQEVTPLELFFDLVFVFAITQVTGFVSADATWTRLVEGLAILAVLWFAWSSYVWLGNTAASDEGAVRVVLLSAMGALLIASLAVPGTFDGDGLIFGIAYFAVRALHIAAYLIVARDDPVLRAVVWRLATTVMPAAALLVVAGALDGTPRALCWASALAVDYGGLAVRGTEGWRVQAGHFAERHGLIVIIALGESIVALGVGAGHLELDAGLIAGALLGIAVAAAMWWAYFDVVAIVAERRLRRGGSVSPGAERLQAAQHRLVQPPAARGRRGPCRARPGGDHGARPALPGARRGRRVRAHRVRGRPLRRSPRPDSPRRVTTGPAGTLGSGTGCRRHRSRRARGPGRPGRLRPRCAPGHRAVTSAGFRRALPLTGRDEGM